jgi:transcriptional regulator with XRE-family HTH domain
MARNNRTHITDGSSYDEPAMAPKHLTKQTFAKRLYGLMMAKGWTQSELARRAGLPRDSVSTYIRAKVMPTPQSAQSLAKALGVKPEDLLPNFVESAIEEDTPSLEMKVSVNAPSKAWLRVNRLVSLATAARVIDLIESEHSKEGESS